MFYRSRLEIGKPNLTIAGSYSKSIAMETVVWLICAAATQQWSARFVIERQWVRILTSGGHFVSSFFNRLLEK